MQDVCSSDVPNPYSLQNILCRDEDSARPQPLWVQLRSRRATIFAAARRLMGDFDIEKLTVRKIADAACVTSPTVYNLIGDRSAVITGAINDYTVALCHYAELSRDHPHFISALADGYWRSASMAPTFVRNIVIDYHACGTVCREEKRVCGLRLITASLQISAARGLTRNNIDLTSVAARASALITSTLYEWAIGTYEYEELGEQLCAASEMVLMSALKGETVIPKRCARSLSATQIAREAEFPN